MLSRRLRTRFCTKVTCSIRTPEARIVLNNSESLTSQDFLRLHATMRKLPKNGELCSRSNLFQSSACLLDPVIKFDYGHNHGRTFWIWHSKARTRCRRCQQGDEARTSPFLCQLCDPPTSRL